MGLAADQRPGDGSSPLSPFMHNECLPQRNGLGSSPSHFRVEMKENLFRVFCIPAIVTHKPSELDSVLVSRADFGCHAKRILFHRKVVLDVIGVCLLQKEGDSPFWPDGPAFA